ncbi:MAG: DUF2127 domain-containing protein [Candidatus Palauibacterales bacterium]|nr:DUF2127 domain-containing protein [Candidatus Palauibacterales bacterium]MDP2530096.1 DUF2127 domain-containing protein [Candidatus Palauibacterales bacterium]MDP2584486.1 DUF2127 domain-containing protein [Candidatus Palauibacterales bacterium]
MSQKPDRLHRLFRMGMWLKGMDGLVEVAGGLVLAVASQHRIATLVHHLVRGELSEDPGDLVANALLGLARHLSVGTRTFVAAYLLVHGLVKLGLVGGLLAERRRVFPVALTVLGLFLGYQVYRLAVMPSVWLGALTVVDAAILGLVAREWRLVARGGGATAG